MMKIPLLLTVFVLLTNLAMMQVTYALPHTQGIALPQNALVLQQRGINYLLSRQHPDGSWLGDIRHPAISALAVLGIYDTPPYTQTQEIRTQINKALDFIASCSQPNGGIYLPATQKHRMGGYATYNTSICLLALATVNRPQDRKIIKDARNYLLTSDAVSTVTPGYGYGNGSRADLNNTSWALEALQATDYLSREPFSDTPNDAVKTDLAWNNAIAFLTTCQNLQATNQSAWIATSSKDDEGGFIYCPDEANKENARPESRKSYGTMTYAAIKSFLYAKLDRNDVRLKAAITWIERHYTLDENPGMGQAGLFYYFHTFSKTMSLLGNDTFTDSSHFTHNWRSELVEKLKTTQSPDGSWQNKTGRWMEALPELSTAYCLMALKNAMTPQSNKGKYILEFP